jgi:flavin reductase (DIM6/NTAB) family NADH-FMN oxidoreductase RutF
MHYDPRSDACPLPYDPFKSCTVPRPIGWLSTISRDGRANLAPYSQWQNITFDPPIVMFAANQHVDGRRKDTVVNAEETGFFVWNMATYALREAVNKSAQDVAYGVDEFEIAGVTKASCITAPGPRVAESPCHFECKYLTTSASPVGQRPIK